MDVANKLQVLQVYDANKIELFLEDLKALVAKSQKKGIVAGMTNAWNYVYSIDMSYLVNPIWAAYQVYDASF